MKNFFGSASLVALLVACAFVAMPNSDARACSCARPQSVKDSLASADAVFEAKVSDVRLEGQTLVATMAVTRAWKGIKKEVVEVQTHQQSATCGFSFTKNDIFVVYAGRNPAGALSTHLCTRTTLADHASEDLAELGAGVTPIDITNEAGEGNDEKPAGEVSQETADKAGCQSCSAGGPVDGSIAFVLLALAPWRRKR